ncbi:hypothetical protein BG004_005633 [Podila humilis]|nr:hypothetical protein BG004_005633 [Podila humilis]
MSVLSDTLPANHRNATNVMLSTLGELETMLEPLFSTPTSLSDTVSKLPIEKRAQLQLAIGYAISTLAFINVKTRGAVPTSHPVMHELKRIQQYTERLNNMTRGNKPTMEVDKGAAERFIKGALASNIAADNKAAKEADAQAGSSSSGTTKASALSTSTSTTSTRKRAMDPLEGYDGSKAKSSANDKKRSKSDK